MPCLISLYLSRFSSSAAISESQSERILAIAVCSDIDGGKYRTTLPTISLLRFKTLLPAANDLYCLSTSSEPSK